MKRLETRDRVQSGAPAQGATLWQPNERLDTHLIPNTDLGAFKIPLESIHVVRAILALKESPEDVILRKGRRGLVWLGGKPEPTDQDIITALRREVLEEGGIAEIECGDILHIADASQRALALPKTKGKRCNRRNEVQANESTVSPGNKLILFCMATTSERPPRRKMEGKRVDIFNILEPQTLNKLNPKHVEAALQYCEILKRLTMK